jgi:hypothetical protein
LFPSFTLCQVEIFQTTMPLATLLVPLESIPLTGLHQVGFIMFLVITLSKNYVGSADCWYLELVYLLKIAASWASLVRSVAMEVHCAFGFVQFQYKYLLRCAWNSHGNFPILNILCKFFAFFVEYQAFLGFCFRLFSVVSTQWCLHRV